MNTQECCDTPRGFVGGTCDYCGGTVQAETYTIGLDTETMNTQIELPATFALHISERHPLADTLPKGELSDFDRSKLYYHCSIHSEGKAIAIESPVFSKDDDDDAEKLRAYSILREIVTETITRALLPPTECPQYECIDGRVVAQIEPNPMRGEFGTIIESDGTERPAGRIINP
jgi:hypothetical protein